MPVAGIMRQNAKQPAEKLFHGRPFKLCKAALRLQESHLQQVGIIPLGAHSGRAEQAMRVPLQDRRASQ